MKSFKLQLLKRTITFKISFLGTLSAVFVFSLGFYLAQTLIITKKSTGLQIPKVHLIASHQRKGISSLLENLENETKKSKILLIVQSKDTGLLPEDERRLADIIFTESKKYKHEPLFILAMIMTESTLYNWSRSKADATGLMQIRTLIGSHVAKELGVSWEGRQTLFDPLVNVRLGVYYFDKLIESFKNMDLALVAYNMGPTKLRELLSKKQKIPTIYARKVKRYYAKLNKTIQDMWQEEGTQPSIS